MPAPTLLQTILGRPTQTYSKARRVVPAGDAGGPADQRHSGLVSERYGLETIPPLAYRHPSAPSSPGRPSHGLAPKARAAAATPGAVPANKGLEDDDEKFYTPRSTPTPSPTSTVRRMPHALPVAEPLALINGPSKPSKRAHSTTSASTSSSARDSEDAFSDYSWARSLSSATSASTHAQANARESAQPMVDQQVFPTATKRAEARAQQPSWAKDVRWLAPPSAAEPQPAHPRASAMRTPPSRPRQKTMPRTPRTPTRMSALVEDDEEDSIDLHADGSGVRRSRSISSPEIRTASSATSSTMRTVDLLTTPATSAGGSAHTGYTSLVLPLAAYTPAKHPAQSLVSNKVDLPRSGIAQTTMSTISITQHGASLLRSRRLSLNGLFGSTTSLPSAMPEHLRASAASPLAFTSRIPPPSKFGSSQVLLQVWAVAVDRLDALLVLERASKADGSGYGFIPGRAFVGRVVESGVDVSNIARGDWVYGCLDVKKVRWPRMMVVCILIPWSQCGALSEFLAVDRRRVHHIPQILQPPTQPRTRRGKTTPGSPPPLTLEQVSFLALAGVPAHRAVRGLAAVIAEAEYERQPDGTKRPVRALVLQAHDGVGCLATQMLVHQNVHVIAQVPAVRGDGSDDVYDHVAVAKAAGASHVLVGDPEDVMDELREMLATGLSWNHDGPGLGEFDCVVDTVGGKSVWESAVTIMREGGQVRCLVE